LVNPERLGERMVSDPVAATDWRQLASDTKIPDGMFIGGERRAALDGSTRSVKAARDGSTLVELAWAQPDDADAAVAAAREAFDHGPWPRLHPRSRGEILQHLDMAVPFGGVKLSGFGRDKSRHALDEYTPLKTTWIRYV
jgi:acyl-CoA reductase-like NAD-dependent aldehyde dehydrogenase